MTFLKPYTGPGEPPIFWQLWILIGRSRDLTYWIETLAVFGIELYRTGTNIRKAHSTPPNMFRVLSIPSTLVVFIRWQYLAIQLSLLRRHDLTHGSSSALLHWGSSNRKSFLGSSARILLPLNSCGSLSRDNPTSDWLLTWDIWEREICWNTPFSYLGTCVPWTFLISCAAMYRSKFTAWIRRKWWIRPGKRMANDKTNTCMFWAEYGLRDTASRQWCRWILLVPEERPEVAVSVDLFWEPCPLWGWEAFVDSSRVNPRLTCIVWS